MSQLVLGPSFGLPVANDAGSSSRTAAPEEIEVRDEAPREALPPIAEGGSTASKHQRASDKPPLDALRARPGAPAAAQRGAEGGDAPAAAMAARVFESVRAPIGVLTGSGGTPEDVAARAAQTAQRRNEMAAAAALPEAAQHAGASGGDDGVLHAIRIARETLREPLVWLALLLLGAVIAAVAYTTRRTG